MSKLVKPVILVFSIFIPFLLIILTTGKTPKDFKFNGKYPPVSSVTYYKNGQEFIFDAFEGLVDIYFKKGTSYRDSINLIQKAGGIILEYNKTFNYFLVEAGKNRESVFINSLQKESSVEYVFLIIPKELKSVYVIDSGDHKKMVSGVAEKCSPGNITVIEKDVAFIEDNVIQHGFINPVLADNHIRDILDADKNKTTNPIFINTSFGTGLESMVWALASDDEKKAFREEYQKDLDHYLTLIKGATVENFYLIKSAGNERIYNFEKEILDDWVTRVSAKDPNDYALMKNHFKLITVTDDRFDRKSGFYRYSNTLTSNVTHPLVANVDISGLPDKNDFGTSAGAPYYTCYLDDIAATYNLTAPEAGTAANKAASSGTLNTTGIYTEAKLFSENKIAMVNDNKTMTSQEDLTNNQIIQPDTLAGTKWEFTFRNLGGVNPTRQTLEFQNDFIVRGSNYYNSYIDNSIVYKYYYDTHNNNWRMYQTTMMNNIMNKTEQEEREEAIRFGVNYLLTISNDKLIVSNHLGYRREYFRANDNAQVNRNQDVIRDNSTVSSRENVICEYEIVNGHEGVRFTNNNEYEVTIIWKYDNLYITGKDYKTSLSGKGGSYNNHWFNGYPVYDIRVKRGYW